MAANYHEKKNINNYILLLINEHLEKHKSFLDKVKINLEQHLYYVTDNTVTCVQILKNESGNKLIYKMNQQEIRDLLNMKNLMKQLMVLVLPWCVIILNINGIYFRRMMRE